MPTVWFSLKKSMHCKSEASDVHDPKTKKHLSTILTKRAGRSGCSRSIANLKDVIHGSKRHLEKPVSCSPRSIGSSEFLNPITHEVILSNSTCELKITGSGGFQEGSGLSSNSTYVGTLRPGTPGPGGHPTTQYFNPSFRNSATPPRKTALLAERKDKSVFGTSGTLGSETGVKHCKPRASAETETNAVTCHKCGEQFGKWEVLEAHHLSKHAGKLVLVHFNPQLLFHFSFFLLRSFQSWSILFFSFIT